MRPRSSRTKGKSTRPSALRDSEGSQPEVQISYGVAGQETMAAIAEELAAPEPPVTIHSPAALTMTEAARAREPYVTSEVRTAPLARREQTTINYGDRISNAPGATTPSRPPTRISGQRPQRSAPEITISESAVGRETMALITAELMPDAHSGEARPSVTAARSETHPSDESTPVPFAIFEMLTFVVQGPETTSLSSEEQRRRFVEDRLLQRLPVEGMAQVDRIDVTPWTVRGTVVVRVWCKI